MKFPTFSLELYYGIALSLLMTACNGNSPSTRREYSLQFIKQGDPSSPLRVDLEVFVSDGPFYSFPSYRFRSQRVMGDGSIVNLEIDSPSGVNSSERDFLVSETTLPPGLPSDTIALTFSTGQGTVSDHLTLHEALYVDGRPSDSMEVNWRFGVPFSLSGSPLLMTELSPWEPVFGKMTEATGAGMIRGELTWANGNPEGFYLNASNVPISDLPSQSLLQSVALVLAAHVLIGY